MRLFPIAAVVFSFLGFAAYAQTAPPVPDAYADLNSQLSTQISAFSATVHSGWNGARYPVTYAPGLLTANSDQASSLLNPNYFNYSVLPELIGHQALGATAVVVHINFPILYQPYYSNPQDFQSYVSFYQQLVEQVHAMGMKLVVESTTASPLAGTNGAVFGPYYQTLGWNDYMTGRAQNALNIAQLIQPDYMSVITEPDTEASNTGQVNAGTQSGSIQLLQTILTTLQNAGSTVPIGAGAGTWINSFTSWITGFASQPIQYVDTHIYPPNSNYLTNALSAADIAHTANKPIALSEAWCEKVRDSELTGQSGLAFNDIEARYVFSFWQTVDIQFLQAMVDMAQYKQFLFMSASWSRYLSASLDYATFGNITDDTTLENDASQAAGTARQLGTFTPVGVAWENMILPAPDNTAPATPAMPSSNNSQVAANLIWPATTDNVGVAGYNLFRNSVLVTTTSGTTYFDTNLTPGTTYTYTISAFDAQGNVSALSPALVTSTVSPPDTQTPTTPANFTAVGLSDKSIQLSWNASTDNVGVSGYRVMRGTSPSSVTNIASTTSLNYVDSAVYPNNTYYYAVVAYDSVNNVSPQSAIVSASPLPDTIAPTTPLQLTATPISSQQINLSWAAATDDIAVAGYKVYRGVTSSSLSLIGSAGVSTVYSDTTVNPTQAYFYAVAAFDAAGNYSTQSAMVSASPVPDTQSPTVPAHLTGTAVSMTQINLSWNASTDNVAVSNYKLYRGLSATSLILMASTPSLTWSDSNSISPGTTYYYAVAATDTSGNTSTQSSVIAVTSQADNLAPAVPSHLAGTAVSMTQINLSWNASTDNMGIASYKLYRGLSATSLILMASTPNLTWSDSNSVSPGTTYYYAIAATDTSGNTSAQSSVVAVTSQADTSAPTVPTNLTGTAVSMTQINLSWNASTDNVGVASYKVYRGLNASSLVLIGSTPNLTWSDSNGLSAGTAYYYSVVGVDTSGNYSAQASPISVTTLPDQTAPTVPTRLTGTAVSKSQISLSWTASTDNVKVAGYKVYRGTSASNLILIGGSSSTTYSDTNGLAANKTYYYSTAAYDPSGNYSAQTSAISVTTPAN